MTKEEGRKIPLLSKEFRNGGFLNHRDEQLFRKDGWAWETNLTC